MKNRIKVLCFFLTPIILIIVGICLRINKVPDTIFIRENEVLKQDYIVSVVQEQKDVNVTNVHSSNLNKNLERKAKVKLFGLIPVKSVTIDKVPEEIMVYPGGQPIGIKLSMKGVLVVALSDITTDKGKVTSPSANAGIQIGDSILKINKTEIDSSEDVLREVNRSQGKKIILTIDRKGQNIKKEVTPIKSNLDDGYKIGLWIRDSTAGVGTLTFYDPKTNKFAALGHPITDMDTGTILSISKGQIVTSSIMSIKKGLRGNPGELKGIFVNEDMILGSIYKNCPCGIYGKSTTPLYNSIANKPVKIALRDEIKEGPAKILTTVDGDQPKYYDIQIVKLLQQDTPGPKSMLIKVTDPVLLQKTGGIVQGMSGSPIIQNGKLVGAVTHVLVNKPDTGYGIYVEWMIKDADLLSQKENLN